MSPTVRVSSLAGAHGALLALGRGSPPATAPPGPRAARAGPRAPRRGAARLREPGAEELRAHGVERQHPPLAVEQQEAALQARRERALQRGDVVLGAAPLAGRRARSGPARRWRGGTRSRRRPVSAPPPGGPAPAASPRGQQVAEEEEDEEHQSAALIDSTATVSTASERRWPREHPRRQVDPHVAPLAAAPERGEAGHRVGQPLVGPETDRLVDRPAAGRLEQAARGKLAEQRERLPRASIRATPRAAGASCRRSSGARRPPGSGGRPGGRPPPAPAAPPPRWRSSASSARALRYEKRVKVERTTSSSRATGSRISTSRRRPSRRPAAVSGPGGHEELRVRGVPRTIGSPAKRAIRPPRARKTPKGSLALKSSRRDRHQRQPHGRAGEGAEEEGHQHPLPAQEGADQGEHLDVAQPHPLLVAPEVPARSRPRAACRRRGRRRGRRPPPPPRGRPTGGPRGRAAARRMPRAIPG